MLQDEKGTVVFPEDSRYGHFVFIQHSGEAQKPYAVVAEIVRVKHVIHKEGWAPNMKELKEDQLKRGSLNVRVRFPLSEVPAIIAALAKTYEEFTGTSAPAEGQKMMREFAETAAEREGEAFSKTDGEFGF